MGEPTGAPPPAGRGGSARTASGTSCWCGYDDDESFGWRQSI